VEFRIERIDSEPVYPDAAWSPKPRDPPVTTTTFPLREKMLGKSWSSVSYLDMVGGLTLTRAWNRKEWQEM
jgi:hypothetical protein